MKNNNATKLQICSNIKAARISTRLSQGKFAEKFGIKRSTYAEWESNIEPDLETLTKIAEAANVPLCQLIGGGVSENNQITKQETVKDLPKSESLDSLIRSNENLTKANMDLAANVVVLTRMLEASSSVAQGTDVAVDAMRHNLLELLSKLGIRDAKHPAKPISILELNRLYADIQNQG